MFRLTAWLLVFLCLTAPSWAATPISENCTKTLISTSDAPNGDKILSYSNVCGGDIENYEVSSGKWADVDMTKETTIGGWRVFQDTRVAAAIKDTVGKIRIYPDKTDLTTHLELDIGAAMSVEKSGHSVVLTRTVAAWDADIIITLYPDGMKKLITFRDKTKIPNTITLGLTLTNLTLSGRKVQKDGVTVFTLPNMFAYAADDTMTTYDVPETLNGTQAIIDLSAVKPLFPGGQSGPWYLDPSVTVQPTSADTFIWQQNPTSNFNSNVSIAVGVNNTGSLLPVRGLGRYDLSAITGTVTSVDFQLYQWNTIGTDTYHLTVYPLKRQFVEAQATWNVYSTGNNWQTAGASGANDYDSTLGSLCDTVPSTIGWHHWTSANMVSMVQAAIGGDFNWIIARQIPETDPAVVGQANYRSNFYTGDLTQRPKITVVTTTAVATASSCPNLTGTPLYCNGTGTPKAKGVTTGTPGTPCYSGLGSGSCNY